jgi:nitroreductase
MEKLAGTPVVNPLFYRRRSPRGFSAGSLRADEMHALLEAARLAPSSFNEQPWRFIIVTREDGEAFERFLDLLVPKNREWARTASALILAVAKTSFSHNGVPNRHAWYDAGQAVASLTLQATDLGISVHQMAGYDHEQARAAFHLPDGYEPVTAIALGRAPGQSVGGHQRRPLSEIAFRGDWGKPWLAAELAA